MINIVEAGKNIEKERKIEMIADIEVYTVMNALIIGAQSIFSYIHYIVGLFVALTGKKWEKYVVYGWEMRRQDVIEYLRKKTQTEIEDMLLETMRKKLKISKKKKKNGDVFRFV